MHIAIDTGTTNTRVYVLNESTVIGRAYEKIGVRDTAISGSKKTLIEGLETCMRQAIQNAGISIEAIEYAVVSGMLTTEMGLIDIPHLVAPVGFEELVKHAKVLKNTKIFPFDIPVVFVRGVKNQASCTSVEEIRKIDFMKGEETQVMGIIETYQPKFPCNIVVLSSHTKLIHLDDQGRIAGSITTMSGQIYEAIKKQTFIGKSIEVEQEPQEPFFSESILERAFESVSHAGFLRSLMVPRFMEVLMETDPKERRFYVESAIASEDIQIMNEAKDYYGYDMEADFIFVGDPTRCKIYKTLLKVNGFDNQVTAITDKEAIDQLVIVGGSRIASRLTDAISVLS